MYKHCSIIEYCCSFYSSAEPILIANINPDSAHSILIHSPTLCVVLVTETRGGKRWAVVTSAGWYTVEAWPMNQIRAMRGGESDESSRL